MNRNRGIRTKTNLLGRKSVCSKMGFYSDRNQLRQRGGSEHRPMRKKKKRKQEVGQSWIFTRLKGKIEKVAKKAKR